MNDTSGQGKRNELMLLIDYNDDLSLHVIPKEEHSGGLLKEKMRFSLILFVILKSYRVVILLYSG